MNLTICPPSEHPHLHFDKSQFIRPRFPVEAQYVGANNGTNGWASKSSLGFDDYSRMSTQKHSVMRDRKTPTPEYVLDEKKFRAVVLRYLEMRASLVGKRFEGTEVERAKRVSELSKVRVERELVRLDELSREFVALRCTVRGDAAEKRLQLLQREIICCDTRIRILREPWVIPAIVKAYYFEGLDSIAVGARVGLNSPNVRQILFRLSKLAKRMEAGTDTWSVGRGTNGRLVTLSRNSVNQKNEVAGTAQYRDC